MIVRPFCLVIPMLLVIACQATPPATSGDCAGWAATRLAAGRAALDRSRDGEHYRTEGFEKAMAELREAAEAGSRDAQSLYGRTLFATRFSNRAPVPSERDDYVSALVALRRAGRAGDAAARRFLPGWSEDPPATSDPPLDALPRAWIEDALAGAAAPPVCP